MGTFSLHPTGGLGRVRDNQSTMTPEQKLKWAVLARIARYEETPAPQYPCSDVDGLYETAVEEGRHWDAEEEVRTSGVETGLAADFSRHYDSDAVAMKMPDGSWVGWTYWHGGGKHGEPSAMPWMEEAYEVTCTEEEKVVTVRTFAAKK